MPDNPFRPHSCLCSGYDVYADLLGNASGLEYWYLLFRQEAPTPAQLRLLNGLAIAVGNAGPRDHSVQAAMTAGAGGAGASASLIAALAVGAGQFGGAREVATLMTTMADLGCDLARWLTHYGELSRSQSTDQFNDVWPQPEHPPGFDPYAEATITPVRQALDYLSSVSPGPHLAWLSQVRQDLEALTGRGVAMSAVAAASMTDLSLDPEEGEMLFLLLRLPGAAAHAIEQRRRGWREFPFYRDGITVTNDKQDIGVGDRA